jgi:hypothetical protein
VTTCHTPRHATDIVKEYKWVDLRCENLVTSLTPLHLTISGHRYREGIKLEDDHPLSPETEAHRQLMSQYTLANRLNLRMHAQDPCERACVRACTHLAVIKGALDSDAMNVFVEHARHLELHACRCVHAPITVSQRVSVCVSVCVSASRCLFCHSSS